MKHIIFLLFLCLGCAAVPAEELPLPNGKTYSNYKISRVEPDGITISHSAGITKLFFHELPPEMQKQFNYDPAKAQQYSQHVNAQKAAAYERSRELSQRAEYDASKTMALESIKKSGHKLSGRIQQITDDGALIYDAYMPVPDNSVPPGFVSMPSNRRSEPVNYQRATTKGEPVFVLGAGRGFTDGSGWESVVYPAGTYQYTSVMGAGKTVKCFAISPESALHNMLENP